MPVRITAADKLLVASLDVGGSDRSPFSAEELVVGAWKRFPDAFGLRGILDDDGVPLYPDSNRVFAEIMGSKPLRKNGLLRKVGDKRYQITEAGLRRARALAGQEYEATSRRSLSRSLQDSLKRLVMSKAAEKRRTGRNIDLTFHDACGYWGITPRSSAMDLEAKLAHVFAVLREAAEYAGAASVDLGKGLTVTTDEISDLQALHEDLQDRFRDELIAIRRRTDERRV
jgi:hypothetical protein